MFSKNIEVWASDGHVLHAASELGLIGNECVRCSLRQNSMEKVKGIVKKMKDKKMIAVIPARYHSSRFPGKPLALILGKPMIQWVYERVSQMTAIEQTYVATDDERIFRAVEAFGGRMILGIPIWR